MFDELDLVQLVLLQSLYIVCIVAFLYCSYTDLRTRRIPNRVTYPLLLITLLVMALCGSLLQAVLGGLLTGGILLVPRILGGSEKAGMGDVKLSALGGMLVGPGYAFSALFISFFLAWIILMPFVLSKRLHRSQPVAFGPYLALGFILVIALYIWPDTWAALSFAYRTMVIDPLQSHIIELINTHPYTHL